MSQVMTDQELREKLLETERELEAYKVQIEIEELGIISFFQELIDGRTPVRRLPPEPDYAISTYELAHPEIHARVVRAADRCLRDSEERLPWYRRLFHRG